MEGKIFVYNVHGSIAYKSNTMSDRSIILIGGLGDGILSIAYLDRLLQFCEENRICLIVPQLRSQPNFELVSIEQDVADVRSIVDATQGRIVLIGHSTGCQDALLYLDSHPGRVAGIVLQAPVSDIEAQDDPLLQERVQEARHAGQYFEYAGRMWLCERFISLFESHGREDLFSSYLNEEDFARWRGRVPILSVLSGNDEYCPVCLEDKFRLMGKVAVIENGDHGLIEDACKDAFIKELRAFLIEIKFI